MSAVEGHLNVLKSMEIQSGHLHVELSVMSQVSAVEGCPLSEVPLYVLSHTYFLLAWINSFGTCSALIARNRAASLAHSD